MSRSRTVRVLAAFWPTSGTRTAYVAPYGSAAHARVVLGEGAARVLPHRPNVQVEVGGRGSVVGHWTLEAPAHEPRGALAGVQLHPLDSDELHAAVRLRLVEEELRLAEVEL